MSQTKRDMPVPDGRPVSDAEWQDYLAQLAYLELLEEQLQAEKKSDGE